MVHACFQPPRVRCLQPRPLPGFSFSADLKGIGDTGFIFVVGMRREQEAWVLFSSSLFPQYLCLLRTSILIGDRRLWFCFRRWYFSNTRACSEPQPFEVALLRLQGENPLILFVLREIPLTKAKTTRFDDYFVHGNQNNTSMNFLYKPSSFR